MRKVELVLYTPGEKLPEEYKLVVFRTLSNNRWYDGYRMGDKFFLHNNYCDEKICLLRSVEDVAEWGYI